ncbi:MAG TPA: hypothetical protein VE988_14135 [Gemmataceae bacterium]|nr:hypothetical protein [Gemmataceae bacterium]
MCRILALMVLCGALAVVTATTAQQPPDKVPLDRVNELIDKLGSTKFAERERAMKELEAFGPAILPALRPAQKSKDAEIKGRVDLLVRKLEDQQMAANLLAGKRVRLNVKNATVPEAVAELARLSGYDLVLNTDAKAFGDRKVTLDTGDTTFWEALQQLCVSAELVDTIAAATKPGKAIAGAKKAAANVIRAVPAAAPIVAVQLSAGKPSDAPVAFAGSLRIKLLKTTKMSNGDRQLLLEVANEPRLAGFTAGGMPVIVKAINDKKQTLPTSVLPIPSLDIPPPAAANNGVGNVIIVNGNMANPALNLATPSFAPFQFTVNVKPGEKPTKKLEELVGKLTVRTMIDTEPSLVIDKILDAAGKTAKAKDGTTVKVNNIKKQPNGDIAVQIATGNGQALNGAANGGAIQIQGAAIVQINGQNVGGVQNASNPFRLLDAKGESYVLAQSSNSGMSINGGQITYTQTLVFVPKVGQGPPAQLVLPGQRSFAFDVPFALKDVVLP